MAEKIGTFLQPPRHEDTVDKVRVTKVTIGAFFEDGTPEPGNQPVPTLSKPSPIPPVTPPPHLSVPANLPTMPIPQPHLTHPAVMTVGQMPDIPPFEDGTLEPGEQPTPILSTPSQIQVRDMGVPWPKFSSGIPHPGEQGLPIDSVDPRADLQGAENPFFVGSFREKPFAENDVPFATIDPKQRAARPKVVNTIGASRILVDVQTSESGQDPYTIDKNSFKSLTRSSQTTDSDLPSTDFVRPDVNKETFDQHLADIDSTVYKMLNNIGVYGDGVSNNIQDPYTVGVGSLAGITNPFAGEGGRNWDPTLTAKHVARLGRHLEASGIFAFNAEMQAMYGFNSYGNVINPAIIAGNVSSEFVPSPIDALAGGTNLKLYEKLHGSSGNPADDLTDIHVQLAKGRYHKFQLSAGIPGFQNIVAGGKVKPPGSDIWSADVEADSQKDGLLTPIERLSHIGNNVVESSRIARNMYLENFDSTRNIPIVLNSQEVNAISVNDYEKDVKHDGKSIDKNYEATKDRLTNFFERNETLIGNSISQRGARGPATDPLYRSFAGQKDSSGWVKAYFTAPDGSDDADKGYFPLQLAGDMPKDDDAYVPLVFTDLRQISNDALRAVYFRPFITSINESFSPEWNLQRYFGRVDPVATYQATNRNISLSFKVVAMHPAELFVIHKKLAWLTSMVYPLYDSDLAYRAGPVIRLRVGDLFNAKSKRLGVAQSLARGVPGIITSLEIDYGSSTWELETDMKLPREFDVSISFHVLHDRPIGLIGSSLDNNRADLFGGVTRDAEGTGERATMDSFRKAFSPGGGKDFVNG